MVIIEYVNSTRAQLHVLSIFTFFDFLVLLVIDYPLKTTMAQLLHLLRTNCWIKCFADFNKGPTSL